MQFLTANIPVVVRIFTKILAEFDVEKVYESAVAVGQGDGVGSFTFLKDLDFSVVIPVFRSVDRNVG